MDRARPTRLKPLLLLALLPAMAGAALADTLTPLSTPALDPSYGAPAIHGPAVPSVIVRAPTIAAPGLCTLEPCGAPTHVEGRSIALPGIEGAGVAIPGAQVPRNCAPQGLACAGPVALPGQDLGATPRVEPQTLSIEGASAPAACSLAPDACAASFQVEGAEHRTPAMAPVQVVPAMQAEASVPGIAVVLATDRPEFGQAGPVTIPVEAPLLGPIAIELCSASCPAPQAPDLPLRLSGDAAARAALGDHELATPGFR